MVARCGREFTTRTGHVAAVDHLGHGTTRAAQVIVMWTFRRSSHIAIAVIYFILNAFIAQGAAGTA